MGLDINTGMNGMSTGASIGGTIGGPIGSVIGGGLGLIGGAIFGKGNQGMTKEDYRELQEEAWGYEKEGMGLQYMLNEKAADATQKRNLEMWNETNYENQRKHMENAGLSVGLMYQNGGAPMSSAGGQQAGVEKPSTNPIQIRLQKEALGLQFDQIRSQNMLNYSQAAKNQAETKKISGVDTQEAESRIGLNAVNKELLNSNIEINAATITKLVAEGQIAMQQYNQELNNTDISNATKEVKINQIIQDYFNSRIAGIVGIAKANLDDAQAKKLIKETENYLTELAIKGKIADAAMKQAEAFEQKVKNDYEQAGIKLDQEKSRLLKEWIYGGVHEFTNIIGTAGNIITEFIPAKKFASIGGKLIQQVTKKGGKISVKDWQNILE